MSQDYAEADIYTVFMKIMKNGHAEMFTNSKGVDGVLSRYKGDSLEDVIYYIYINTICVINLRKI